MATQNNMNFTSGVTGQILTGNASTPATFQSTQVLILTASVTITSAQIKALNATPIEIIANPGSGKTIVLTGLVYKFIYGGNNAFTLGSEIDLAYGSGIIANSGALSTANMYSTSSFTIINFPIQISNRTLANISNTKMQLKNFGAEYTGNAANDNSLLVYANYFIGSV